MKKVMPYVFTKKDVDVGFDSEEQYQNCIAGLVRSKKIVKVRKGLYVSIDQWGQTMASKYEIATKVAPDAFICYHSALEYYGIANQVFNVVTIGSESRFNSFMFEDIQYVRKLPHHNVQIENSVTAGVRVTSRERTIVDCIDNIDEAGGIDEIFYAIDQIRVLDENKLINTLNAYNSVFLYQKVGFVLSIFNERLMLSKMFFDECKAHLTKQVKYLLKNECSKFEYNSEWQLMVPKNLKSRIRGDI